MTTPATSLVVAIHQPNFFPWLGYFDKICRADVFVLLDDVDYPRAGSGGMGSWTNRVRINIQGEARWIGCPIRRMPLGSPIRNAEIDDAQPWRAKLIKTLEANYRRADNYQRGMELLVPLIESRQSSLADFNIAAIQAIARHLRLECTFVRQSALPAQPGSATELLTNLVRCVGGGAYLAGSGAAGYQEDNLFAERGLDLMYQNFRPLPYGPESRFIPGLSIMDYLLHDGRPVAAAFPDKQP